MIKYYAMPLWDLLPFEIENHEPVIEEEIEIDLYPDGDANNEKMGTVTVTVIRPDNYDLTDKDYQRIDELVNENV